MSLHITTVLEYYFLSSEQKEDSVFLRAWLRDTAFGLLALSGNVFQLRDCMLAPWGCLWRLLLPALERSGFSSLGMSWWMTASAAGPAPPGPRVPAWLLVSWSLRLGCDSAQHGQSGHDRQPLFRSFLPRHRLRRVWLVAVADVATAASYPLAHA